MNFQQLLVKTRKNQKMSLKELEKQSGVSQSVISYYEHGGQPTLQKADALLRVLGKSIILGNVTEAIENDMLENNEK